MREQAILAAVIELLGEAGYEAMTILANGTVLETRGFADLRIP